ncbi:GbsR/MarR family transcriptional regulator [Amycolatopsis sp. NPDC051758]|uniref:GbsR/MarR family transcriptional regulator n=1 Tax=Amycolatopsis sp. NPDC051758 TaxID=3363935 RepID=UPI0037986DDC
MALAAGEDALIEDFGLHIGRAMGWPPMAGRTSGVLMLSEKPLTLAELQEALDASKGSASEMTRLLIDNGVVERFKEPGSRQFVFRWRDDAWVGCLQHQVTVNRELLELAENAQVRGKHLPAEQRGRLRQMRDYYVFMTEQLEALLTEYTRLAKGER